MKLVDLIIANKGDNMIQIDQITGCTEILKTAGIETGRAYRSKDIFNKLIKYGSSVLNQDVSIMEIRLIGKKCCYIISNKLCTNKTKFKMIRESISLLVKDKENRTLIKKKLNEIKEVFFSFYQEEHFDQNSVYSDIVATISAYSKCLGPEYSDFDFEYFDKTVDPITYLLARNVSVGLINDKTDLLNLSKAIKTLGINRSVNIVGSYPELEFDKKYLLYKELTGRYDYNGININEHFLCNSGVKNIYRIRGEFEPKFLVVPSESVQDSSYSIIYHRCDYSTLNADNCDNAIAIVEPFYKAQSELSVYIKERKNKGLKYANNGEIGYLYYEDTGCEVVCAIFFKIADQAIYIYKNLEE